MKLPSLCKQKRPSGDLAYVRIQGTKFYCGDWGTPQADEVYQRIITEWLATKRTPATTKAEPVTVRVLVAAFLDHAETFYVKNGRLTRSYTNFLRVSRLLVELYGGVPVNQFGPLSLESLRERLINSRKSPTGIRVEKPLSRYTANKYVGLICQIFSWGVGRELVKPETHYALSKLPPLKKGKTRAIELPPVKPVADEAVEKTLPFLPSPVAAMVRLQRLTGMRPGEVRAMRLCDIDTTPAEWLYIPWEHKTEHHDCPRLIALGPQSQSILMPWLIDRADSPEKWLFSPADSMAERHAKARECRKTKVQPSQRDRSKAKPKTQPGDQYTTDSYRRVIRRAAERAGVPHWFPNQLRHSALTAIRAKEGIEAAQVMANHKNVQITEIYAEKDVKKACELARKWG